MNVQVLDCMTFHYKEQMKYTTHDFQKVFCNREHGIQGVTSRFSVLVPVIDINGEAHILYELRSSHIDRQPGEVCFPGGEIEPGETPCHAALRETREEIGIPEEQIRILAELDTFHPPTNIVIYPFLGELCADSLKHLRLNADEVAECFPVPVSFLLQEPYIYRYSMQPELGEDFRYDKIGRSEERYNWRPMKHQIISWEYDGKYIWGLTALITRWTLEILQGLRP